MKREEKRHDGHANAAQTGAPPDGPRRLFAGRAGAQVEFTHMEASHRDIRKTVIADGISQFMTMRDSYVRQLNWIVIVNDKDVLVFNSNTRPSSARLILAEIRKMTDKPVRYVVNSHGHPDHWSGNDVYADAFPGLEIIATEQTDQLMRKMADVWPVKFADELKARKTRSRKRSPPARRRTERVLTPEQRRQDQSDLSTTRPSSPSRRSSGGSFRQ